MESSSDDKINLLIKQNKAILGQLAEQTRLIAELKNDNKNIKENTDKMGQHINFINGAYEKITKSYLLKSIFN